MRRLALLALFMGACAIDPGATPTTTACAPSPDFFVSSVWPQFLVDNHCGGGGCHSFSDGHGTLRLHDIGADPMPAPKQPLGQWALSWRENYLSTIHLVDCKTPLQSRLLTVPEGDGNLHPPGPVVLDRQTAESLVQQWVTAP